MGLENGLQGNEKQVADIIFVGAGLANSLLSCFLRARHPELKILLLEAKSEIPSGRTWCFHDSDLTADQRNIVRPLIAKSWPAYEVQFPFSNKKLIHSGYNAIQPQKLQSHLQELFGDNLRFNAHVATLTANAVHLKDGTIFTAECVIDGRGCPESEGAFAPCGYQKFVGLHLKLSKPHGLAHPTLMDANIPQLDGYRFIYVLPWTSTELLIEDTRYSGNTAISSKDYQSLILRYAESKGWKVEKVLSTETGVLPLPFTPVEDAKAPKNAVPQLGMAGGFFHPVTGYSLPDAVRIADLCSKLKVISSQTILQTLHSYRKTQSSNWKYLCLLNRMMFLAAKPETRYQIFERFYRLDKKLIQRFYSGQLLLRDKLRILMGRPPVPVLAALTSIRRVNS